jgi:4'-phosphopantetheinyl transferase
MEWLVRGESEVPAGRGWLTEVEARRAASMRFTKRRTEYLLRRYAGKCAVAAVQGLGEDPSTLARVAVLNAPTGAPYVEVDGTRLGLDVSLTDRAGWAVCLVGPDLGAVGCDLEIVEPRSEGFVRDFLTRAEQQRVAAARDAHGSDGWDATANLIWSAKESALKVLRTGLRADTRTVEVSLGEGPGGAGDPGVAASDDAAGAGWHALAVDTRLGSLPGWWRRDGVFLLTVVAGHADALAHPPEELPGSAPLIRASPMHSWVADPVATD